MHSFEADYRYMEHAFGLDVDKSVQENGRQMIIKKKILIAEDDLLNRELLVALLEDRYETIEAENGEIALELLQKHKDTVSLVLLDLNMPVMDGFGFLDAVKADRELSLIPVIVTTQEESQGTEVDALRRGATDFVPKPYSKDVLFHRVASIIKLRESAAFVNQMKVDRLTGLLNKEYFCLKAEELLKQNTNTRYSLLCTDIENFKLYNDIFGFESGNILLRELAELMKREVGEHGICGRLNADRFVCLIERNHEVESRDKNVQRIAKEDGVLRNSVLRWGIYEVEDISIPVDNMCDRAQLAVDSIKGRYNRYYQVYDDSLREQILKERMITDQMQSALNNDEFQLYLQPKFNLRDNRICGAEALVRWISPEFGMISPGIFIPLFEKNGFVFELDCYVWEKVCQILKSWSDSGREIIPISVNVSRADLFKNNLSEVLTELVSRYEIDPSLLHLEITESAYSDNPRQIISMVDSLHKAGFVIEMDDFGSGYSSLNMLGSMKVDVLKLDRGFIINETGKHPSKSILSDVIVMAHKLRLEVVAEGIETVEQMNRLKAENCDIAQGFLMAKPMPASDFDRFIDRHSASGEPGVKQTARLSSKRGILIADIDDAYIDEVTDIFKDSFKVYKAHDTEGALEILRNAAENESEMLSAVILSYFLPDSGAMRVLNYIRGDTRIWNLPVLLLIEGSCDAPRYPELDKSDDFICRLHPMFDIRKKVDHLINIKEYQTELNCARSEANIDFLTGLLNRRGLDDASITIGPKDIPLALCIFDIDNMKEINDRYGHDYGDKSIRGFAEVLVRKSLDSDILCRFGGDEFIAIMRNIGSAEDAIVRCQSVIDSFRESFEEDGVFVSCSGGVAIYSDPSMSYEALFEQADRALYEAKKKNRNNIQVFGGGGIMPSEEYYRSLFG